jgi:MbtH protein
MNTNPFEDPDGSYLVLTNDEGQHSLWPFFAKVPVGWSVVHDADTRDASLKYIENNWMDMRSKAVKVASSE